MAVDDDRRAGARADRPAGPRGRGRVDRSAPARQLAGAGGPTQIDRRVRIAAARGGRSLRPRRGRAARALVPAADRGQTRHLARRASRCTPRRSRSTSFQRSSAARCRPGTDVAQILAQKQSRARLTCAPIWRGCRRWSRRARRIGWRRTPTRSPSSRPACARRTGRPGRQRRLHQAGDAAQLRRGDRQAERQHRLHGPFRASTTTSRTCRAAIRTSTSA